MGIIFGLLSMFGWGTADFLGAKFSRKIGYFLTFFWMQVAGFAIAFIYFLAGFPSLATGILNFIPILILVGLINAISYSAFYKGLQIGQVSLVSPLASSWALVTVLLGVIFLQEVLLFNQILALILIIPGIVLASINIKEFFLAKKLTIFKGVKEGLIAMFGWGVLFFLMTNPVRSLGWLLPPLIFRFFTILFLVVFMLAKRQSFQANFQLSFFISLSIIGFLDIGSWFTYNLGIRGDYVAIVAPVAASFPIVTIVLARIFLKERLVLNQLIGVISVITGIILISI